MLYITRFLLYVTLWVSYSVYVYAQHYTKKLIGMLQISQLYL